MQQSSTSSLNLSTSHRDDLPYAPGGILNADHFAAPHTPVHRFRERTTMEASPTPAFAPALKLGFGCMRLPLLAPDDPTSVDVAQFERMVDAFIAAGGTYFDTAWMYHQHTSETFVRDALVRRHSRPSFTLATKMPCNAMQEAADMPRIFAEQLEKCGVDFFDFYLLHNVNGNNWDKVRSFDTFGFCRKLRDEGKITHLGFSFHDGPELLDEILTVHPDVDFVQLQLNYLDWDDPGIASGRCYDVARAHGVPVVVMEPVKGGALANVPASVTELFEQARPGSTPASWALRFAASQPGVMCVLSGMSSEAQLADNLATFGGSSELGAAFEPLGDAELAVVRQAADIIKRSSTIPCTTCRYCEEGCPEGIAIPDVFALYNASLTEADRAHAPQRAQYRELAEAHAPASACVKCGACEQECPQHLPIRELLGKVVRSLENH